VISVTTFAKLFALTGNEHTLFTLYNSLFIFSTIVAVELGNVRSIHLALVEILRRIVEIRIGAG